MPDQFCYGRVIWDIVGANLRGAVRISIEKGRKIAENSVYSETLIDALFSSAGIVHSLCQHIARARSGTGRRAN